VKPHEAAFLPGPPPVLWSPYVAYNRPGLAAWNRSQRIWYLLGEVEPAGDVVANHAVLLTPEHALDSAADLAARVDTLEQIIRERFPRSP
jgi:hypothetical protein